MATLWALIEQFWMIGAVVAAAVVAGLIVAAIVRARQRAKYRFPQYRRSSGT